MQGFNVDASGILRSGEQRANAIGNAAGEIGTAIEGRIQENKKNELNQQMANVIMSGNEDDVIQFAAQNPELAKQTFGIYDHAGEEAKKKNVESYAQALQFLDSGDKEGALNYLKDHAEGVAGRGGVPTSTLGLMEAIVKDPSQDSNAAKNIIHSSLATTMGPDEYMKFRQAGDYGELTPQQEIAKEQWQQQFGLQKDKLAFDKSMTQQKFNFDKQVTGANLALKKANLDLNRASSESQRLGAEVKAKKAQQELDQLNDKALGSYQQGMDQLSLIDSIREDPGFSDYVGGKGASMLGGLKDEPFAGTDAASVKGKIDTLKSQNFLQSIQSMKGMGALSDKEGDKLVNAVSSLDSNMTESAFNKSLNVIERITKRGLETQKKKLEKNNIEIPTMGSFSDDQESGSDFQKIGNYQVKVK